MNKIEQKLNLINNNKKTALVCYITAGDPSIGTTESIVLELEKSGADIIELGIPFSDPMADGPTIQLASERSLAGGTTIHDVLNIVKNIREHSDIPLILFGYYNPFFSYGLEKFAKDAKDCGADGVLVVDLPPEESEEFKQHLDENGLDLIFLLAPTSNEERIKLVSENASGFIYLVSITGVTGSRPDMEFSLTSLTKTIKEKSKLPVGIGFGVSSPEQAREISSYADAVIVGSALVKIIEKNGNDETTLLSNINNFVTSLSEACVKD
ncbi:MAG: tryptophan synthase subunit alpha [Thermodesulfobacteriota bacterium]